MLPTFSWPIPCSPKQSLQLLAQFLTTGSLLHSRPPSTFLFNTILRFCNSSPLHFFHLMHSTSTPFDTFTFHLLFKSFPQSTSLLHAQMAHGLLLKQFPDSGPLPGNSLVQMYFEFGLVGAARMVFGGIRDKNVVSWTTMVGGLVRFGVLDEAEKMFDEMPERNVVSWTSMVGGYLRAGRATVAVGLFKKMLLEGVVPDAVALISALTACAQLRDLELGKWIHGIIGHENIPMNRNLASALVDMYAKCGDIVSAHQVFNLMGRKVLPAWNALIDGYCKMGDINVARELFDQMEDCDIITFNSMISGYIHSGHLNEALLLFVKLRASRLCPNKFTLVGVLTACASSGSLSQGKAFHAYIESSSIKPDIFLGTALVDMYSKCGKMDHAMLVFNRMKQRDVVTWTAIISGLAMNGMGKLALEHFSVMTREGIRPNAVAYIAVLNACSHSGLIEEGRKNFKNMQILYNIEPEIEHYGCMVDLLGRCGHLEEAEQLIRSMRMRPNAVIWASLLNACRVHKNRDLAEKAAVQVLELEPNLDAGYVQLYHMYMDSGRQFEASKIRRLMEEKGIKKSAGFSSVTVNGKAYKFIAGNQSHPESAEIEEMMREIVKRLRGVGYSPRTGRVSVEMDEEEKEEALFGHSERMAIAFGLMRLNNSLPIHILKNLRVCEDCHDWIKLISKVWSREIVVRDRSRFHHFRDGQCSCNDFW